jgi:hypothetical protein
MGRTRRQVAALGTPNFTTLSRAAPRSVEARATTVHGHADARRGQSAAVLAAAWRLFQQ